VRNWKARYIHSIEEFVGRIVLALARLIRHYFLLLNHIAKGPGAYWLRALSVRGLRGEWQNRYLLRSMASVFPPIGAQPGEGWAQTD
jgi:hypothetical protein